MSKINKNPEGRSSSSSGSGARMHSVVINSGHRSGTMKKREVGRDACSGKGSATSGIATPSKPDSLFQGPVSSTTRGTATPTASKRSPQSWYPSLLIPIEANGLDSDVDFVHWQSSQTTNPALNSLLKEASSEEFGSCRLGTSSSRISPSWQHSPAKSPSLMVNMSTTAMAGSSSSARKSLSSGSRFSPNMAVDPNPAAARLRIRRTASGSGSFSPLVSHPQRHHNWPQKNAQAAGGDKGFASPFTSSDPDQILEMMRGVSAMIDENMSSNTPITKTAAKEKKRAQLAVSTSATAVGRSWSSMDVDMEGGGPVESPLSRFEKKGKGKGRERDSVDESPMDADVSMADASVILGSHGPLEGLHSGMKSGRRGMLPPPAPISRSKPMPLNTGPNPTTTLGSLRSGRSAFDSTSMATPSSGGLLQEAVVIIDDDSKMASKSKEPEIQLHPMLLEKERLKENKRSQEHASPVPVGSIHGNVAYSLARPNPPARVPLTRTTSIPDTTVSQSVRSSQSPGPPLNASQSSRQGPPRLGMGTSRTAPLPSTPNAPTSKSGSSLPTKNTVATKSDQKKTLLKPFKPPSRVNSGVMSQSSQPNTGNPTYYGLLQRTGDHNYGNRSAYPSPSPGSDDSGKKENEEEEKEIERDLRRAHAADEQVQAARLSKRGPRAPSPPALPPTPESVSKGGSEPEDQEDGIKSEIKGIEHREDMDGVEGGDPDSSFSDMAFDISIDALEETMRKYD